MNKQDRRPTDWRCVLALAWAIGFGTLYARAMVEAKMPRAAGQIGKK